MHDKRGLEDKLKSLEKFVALGGEDRLIDQTITKLLDHATTQHQRDLEDLATKLGALEKQFGMTSEQFADAFYRGELGDEEAFFRWDALLEMQRRLAQRLAALRDAASA